jgi:hypothetical protein
VTPLRSLIFLSQERIRSLDRLFAAVNRTNKFREVSFVNALQQGHNPFQLKVDGIKVKA